MTAHIKEKGKSIEPADLWAPILVCAAYCDESHGVPMISRVLKDIGLFRRMCVDSWMWIREWTSECDE